MPVRMFHAGPLFGIAVEAARSIKAPLRVGGQQPALISVVFSVVALEAFINEVTGAAEDAMSYPAGVNPQEVSVFAQVMADAENSRARLESKFTLASWILGGRQLDRGASPYQDFALLTRLRNDLVHFKANDAFEQSMTPEELHKDLLRRFAGKHVLAEDIQYTAGSWTYLIETKAVAEWSCKTAANMVSEFCSSIKNESTLKVTCDLVQQNFQSQCAILDARNSND